MKWILISSSPELYTNVYLICVAARSDSGTEHCEYDLDNDDEVWLSKVNNERKILPAERYR